MDLWERVREPGSLPERIASQIEDLISTERLKPGDRLPAERELAGILGVSRPSLREAVRSLAAAGRLTVKHGQGIFVEDPSKRRLREELSTPAADIDELFAMREVLEVPGAGWAAQRATKEQLQEIQAAFDALTEAADRRPVDWKILQRLDAEFHEAIVLAAGNRFMEKTVGVLNEIMLAGMETSLQAPGRLHKSARDHSRLLEALLNHEPAAARTAVRTHIRGAHKAARQLVEDRREK